MRTLFIASTCALVAAIALVWSASGPAGGQTWSPARTPWGDPDLQGIWTNQTSTPLERPNELGGRAALSEEEAEEREEAARLSSDNAPRAGDPGTYNAFWRDPGQALTRTSLIIDPPDGRVPPLTPEATLRLEARAADRRARGPADSWEDFSTWTRCITRGLIKIGSFYSSNHQILQAPGYVVILQELIHEARIIPLDGRPPLPHTVRQWMGDSRGRWEGNTLVIDTTNFTDKNPFRGSGETLHLVERLTRADADTIDYQFTVDDPKTFTRQWTVSMPMTRGSGLFEYACHEGNYAMTNMLAGARAEEQTRLR